MSGWSDFDHVSGGMELTSDSGSLVGTGGEHSATSAASSNPFHANAIYIQTTVPKVVTPK